MCIKANELDLALDVFSQLLREGCTPNLVTYNILIDVCNPLHDQPAMSLCNSMRCWLSTRPEAVPTCSRTPPASVRLAVQTMFMS